ncbi:MAG: hypothetical protein ACE5MI_14645 [Acidimicrobiia bacterium]
MARTGRPRAQHPRGKGLFIRFSATEFGSLLRALEAEHPVAQRRPNLSQWARELLVAHASQVLGVEVTRSGLKRQRGGVADWKRWRLARAVRKAAKRRRRIR